MVSVFFWLPLVFTFVSITCIIVFGDSPGLRDSPIHKLRLHLVRSLGQFKNAYSRLDTHLNGNLAFYLNCFVPTAYLAIITFCLDQFFTKTFPTLIKTPGGPNYFWIVITISMIYVSTALAVFSDPGDAAKKPDRSNFINNQLIFFSGNVCSTCDIVKPARSKHCSVCKKCYLLFDHHCLWVNNCVGYYNYRWFLLYLLSNMNFLGYGFYVCFQCLKYEKLVRGGSYWHIIKATTQENEITGIFVILCFLFVIIVVLFTGLHLRYIYLGVTTNEVDKWSEVEHLVNLGALYRIEDNNIRGEQFLEQANSGNEVVYISLKNQDILLSGPAIQDYNLVQIQSVEHDLVNIYDNGFWNNFKERVFPI